MPEPKLNGIPTDVRVIVNDDSQCYNGLGNGRHNVGHGLVYKTTITVIVTMITNATTVSKYLL